MRGLLLALLAGCGRLAFDPIGAVSGDASGDGDRDGETACVWGPWSAPVEIPELSSSDPEEREDGLEMFAVDSIAGTFQIMAARRTSVASAFSPFVEVTELNSPAADQDPALTADGLEIFFVSNRSGPYRAYTSRRPGIGVAFAAPSLVAGLEGHPINSLDISGDGLTMYAAIPDELYRAIRPSRSAAFGAPQAQFPMYSNTQFPTVSPDERELYFNSNPPGIVMRARADPTSYFTYQNMPIPGLVGGADPDLSADGSVLVVSQANLARMFRACQ